MRGIQRGKVVRGRSAARAGNLDKLDKRGNLPQRWTIS